MCCGYQEGEGSDAMSMSHPELDAQIKSAREGLRDGKSRKPRTLRLLDAQTG